MTEKDLKMAFKNHHKEMVSYVSYLLGSNVYSEDIVADCFLELIEKEVPVNYSVKPYLYERARTKCLTVQQQSGRVLNRVIGNKSSTNDGNKTYLSASKLPPGYGIDVNRNLESEDWADGMIIRAELVAAIVKQMESLPPQRRKIFDYIFIQKLDYHEISTIMGITIDTVRVQKHRIVKAFKKKMGLDIDKKTIWYYLNGSPVFAKYYNERDRECRKRKLSPSLNQ